MSTTTCTVDNCRRRAKARGYCTLHYKRFNRHGDVAPRPRHNIPPEVIAARLARLTELSSRRRKLNLPLKSLAYILHINPSLLNTLEYSKGRYGDAAIDRYESALRTHATRLRAWLDEWGY